jgi:cytochrome bd-type quinol oxidase subunit 2
VESHIATEAGRQRASRRTARATAVLALGPLVVLGGLTWAFLQPYRITLLHPYEQGFWWLFVEPPLWVALAGLCFHALVAPGVVQDLEDVER